MFFPCLRPFRAIALQILTLDRFVRDKEAHIHRLIFSFDFSDLSFSCLFKIRAKCLDSQCRKTESLKKEVYNGIFCIFAF